MGSVILTAFYVACIIFLGGMATLGFLVTTLFWIPMVYSVATRRTNFITVPLGGMQRLSIQFVITTDQEATP